MEGRVGLWRRGRALGAGLVLGLYDKTALGHGAHSTRGRAAASDLDELARRASDEADDVDSGRRLGLELGERFRSLARQDQWRGRDRQRRLRADATAALCLAAEEPRQPFQLARGRRGGRWRPNDATTRAVA